MGILMAAWAAAGTLTVTSPTENAFLGTSNTLHFNVTDAFLEVTVSVDVTGPGGTTHLEKRVQPDPTNHNASDTIPINFSQSSPEGAYTITVTATEPGNTYNTVVIHVTVDVTKPKFFDFNPTPNAFVKGPTVPIVVKVIDANFKEYRVQVDNQDIPNNTGTTLDANNNFTVTWTLPTNAGSEGAHNITVTVKDQAQNESTQTLTVTIDRIQPTSTIVFPRSDTNVRPHSTVSVVVDVRDQSGSSVDVTGVDVVLRDINNNFLMRVPRTSFQAVSSNTVRWSGRIRSDITLPHQFKVVATSVDKAGNVGVTQTTTVHVG